MSAQCSGAKRYALPCQRSGQPNYGLEFYCHDHERQAHDPGCLFVRLFDAECDCGAKPLGEEEIAEAMADREWLAELEDELAELERTDPAVAEARAKYDAAVNRLTRAPASGED